VHLNQIDLNLFVVLEAIYREGNLTRAGQQLNLTQPAISHALKRLRDLLNDPLFIRNGSKMVPTPFTRNIIGDVRRALQTIEVSLYENRNFDLAHLRRNFQVAFWEHLEALALPILIKSLRQSAPEISITTHRVKRKDIPAELASGSLDLAVDVPMSVGDNILQQPLYSERIVVVARSGHPAIKAGLNLETYLAQDHVLVSSRRHGPSLVDVELNRCGKSRRVFLRCQHYFAACEVVKKTDMLLTMPERYATLLNPRYGNRIYPFPVKTLPRLELQMYWHESSERDWANRWLREMVKTAVNGFGSQAKRQAAGY